MGAPSACDSRGWRVFLLAIAALLSRLCASLAHAQHRDAGSPWLSFEPAPIVSTFES
jgi:hypothetical protein